jgi:hypothetical protein
MICQGDILTHQYPNCSVIQERTCEYGCANGACNPPPPKQCNNGSLCIAFVSPTPIDGSNVTDIQIKTNVTGGGKLSSFIDFDRSLFSYWDFNRDLLDKSGYANHGINYGATCNVGAIFGLACSFDGFNDYILAKGLTMTPRDSWALEAWIKPAVLPQAFGSAVYNGYDHGGYGFGIGNGFDESGSTLTGLFGGVRWINAGYIFPSANQWYHVAMIRSEETLYFYVNGELKYIDVLEGPSPPDNHLTIGCELDGSHNPYRYFNGAIDEVRVWNRALSEQEIKASYNSQIYALERNFTDLAFREYEVYAYVTDQFKASDKTEIRVIKNIQPRGISGDLWADVIIGQPDFSQVNPKRVVPYKLFNPGGTIVDRSVSPGRMYVWDSSNNRILGIDLAKCYSSSTPCTADIVIGQPSGYDHGACNLDSGFQGYPERAIASASTLCGVPESAASITEWKSFVSMFVDSAGNLYVPDHMNNRVLKYNSPFTTDTIADEVWGQDDFTGNKCNKGVTPSATSLCFMSDGASGAGVSLDSAGNLWVADGGNNRVLRFPKISGVISKMADLVLGQPDFTTGGDYSYGTGLNRMHAPTSVRIDSGGKVYVTENEGQRVLVFTPPFTSGMSGALFGSGFCHPLGIEIDPAGAGIWVYDHDNPCGSGNGALELWNFAGTAILKNAITPNPGGGSVGIDSLGDLLPSTYVMTQDVHRFVLQGSNYILDRNLFSPPYGYNKMGAANLAWSVEGVEVAGDQLIVSDGARLLFWNNKASLTNGKAADGVVGAVDFESQSTEGCCRRIKKDNSNRLWTILAGPAEIRAYQLPLTTGASPIKKINFNPPLSVPVLGGGQVTLTSGSLDSIVPVDNGNLIWVSHPETNRVFRIRNPMTTPVIDVILGQKNINGTLCNRGLVEPPGHGPADLASGDMLCRPGALAIDKLGNLYVSDHSLEVEGNWRLLVFNKNLFPTDNTAVIFAPTATKIFPYLGIQHSGTFQPAFDSTNRMVVGYNGYLGGRFVGYYNNPLGPSTEPDGYLKDFWSGPYSAVFDENGDLYISDMNRARVLIYKKPFQ